MNFASWFRSDPVSRQEKLPAPWLQPSQNRWGVLVLDCTQFADGMISCSANAEVAKRYAELRHASGRELPALEFLTVQRVPCDLTYAINKQPADGPVFKSRVMEEKWDIYLYDQRLFFCRSWSGELVYRAMAKCEPPELKILTVESKQGVPEKLAIRQVDFLVKSHLLSAAALHPLSPELGRDAGEQLNHSFSCFGVKGRYGTLEETIGTAYYWNQRPVTNK